MKKFNNTVTIKLVPFQIENIRFSRLHSGRAYSTNNADQCLPLQFFNVRTKIRHKLFGTVLTLFIMLACLFVSVCAENNVDQDVDLFWSTTYDCDEWTQSQGDPNCDGLAFYGGWTCNGDEEQITSAANYPGGNGGKGQRHWVGDGVNQNSGGLKKEFSFVQSELWIRWYMRYESGFQWNPLGYDKWLYIDVGDNDAVIPQWYGSDKVNIHSAVYGNDGQNHPSPEGNGWNTIMNGPTSDGQFHCYEIHIEMDMMVLLKCGLMV